MVQHARWFSTGSVAEQPTLLSSPFWLFAGGRREQLGFVVDQEHFKAEFLNTMNRTQLPAPNTDPRNAQFGEIRAVDQANYPRRVQLTAKFLF